MILEDETGKKIEAMTVFTESIRYLKNLFLINFVNSRPDLQKQDVLYVLTVPAIWSDPSKQFMRNAAEQVWYFMIASLGGISRHR